MLWHMSSVMNVWDLFLISFDYYYYWTKIGHLRWHIAYCVLKYYYNNFESMMILNCCKTIKWFTHNSNHTKIVTLTHSSFIIIIIVSGWLRSQWEILRIYFTFFTSFFELSTLDLYLPTYVLCVKCFSLQFSIVVALTSVLVHISFGSMVLFDQ